MRENNSDYKGLANLRKEMNFIVPRPGPGKAKVRTNTLKTLRSRIQRRKASRDKWMARQSFRRLLLMLAAGGGLIKQ